MPKRSSCQMYCRKCGYDLRFCASHACSECGQAFDPLNRATYQSGLPSDSPGVVLGVLGGYFLIIFGVFFFIGLSESSPNYQLDMANAIIVGALGALVVGSLFSPFILIGILTADEIVSRRRKNRQ